MSKGNRPRSPLESAMGVPAARAPVREMYVGSGTASSIPRLMIKEPGQRQTREAHYDMRSEEALQRKEAAYRPPSPRRGGGFATDDYDEPPRYNRELEDARNEIDRLRARLDKHASGADQAAGDIARDDTGSRGLDLTMFDAGRSHDQMGKAPTINPLSKIQKAQEAIAMQVQGMQQQIQNVLGQIQQLSEHTQMLEQQGMINQEQAGQMNMAIGELQQSLYPQGPQMMPPGQLSNAMAAQQGEQPVDPGMESPSLFADGEQPLEEMPEAPMEGYEDPTLQGPDPYDPYVEQQMMAEGGGPGSMQAKYGPTGQGENEMGEMDLQRQPRKRQQPGGKLPGGLQPNQPGAGLPSQYNTVQTAVKTTSVRPQPQHAQQYYVYKSASVEEDYVHPAALFEVMAAEYGTEWLDWEPETLVARVSDGIGEALDPETQTVLYALQVLVAGHEQFWTDPVYFKTVVQGLNEIDPDFDEPPGDRDGVTAPQIMFAVRVAQLLKAVAEPSIEVRRYVAVKFLERGITYLTPTLSWAQKESDALCARSGTPCPDNAKVQQRLQTYAKTPLDEVELSSADPVDHQVAHLLTIRDYVMDREATLDES